MKKNTANRPKLVAKATAFALRRPGCGSTRAAAPGRGCGARSGRRARRRPPRARTAATIHQVVKPAFSPSITAKVSARDRDHAGDEPRHVERAALRGRSSPGASTPPPRAPASPNPRLNQKIPRQPHAATSRPPSTGPAASEIPETDVQTPSARRAPALVRVDLADQRQRPRLARRRADAHHDPARDQRVGAVRERADERAGAEERRRRRA